MSTSNSNEIRRKEPAARQELRSNQELSNPCLKEHKLSLKCLNDNDYLQEQCAFYFENYKQCRYFWASVIDQRKQNRIYPELPPPEERDKIKAEYFNSIKNIK